MRLSQLRQCGFSRQQFAGVIRQAFVVVQYPCAFGDLSKSNNF